MRPVKPALSIFGLVVALCLLPHTALAGEKEEALWHAAREGDVATLKTLLAEGVDTDARNRYGATALFFACDRGHTDVVRTLIEHGADVNAKDTFYGVTPLIWAVYSEHLDALRLLLEHGAEGGGAALRQAVDLGNLEMLQLLLERSKPTAEELTAALAQAERQQSSGQEGAAVAAQAVALLKAAGARPAPPAVPQTPAEPPAQSAESNQQTKKQEEKTGEEEEKAGEEAAERSPEPTARPRASRNWPAFRGDNADGTADGAHPPVHWDAVEGENLRWKTAIPGIAHSSPIVWGDKVFVTTAVNTAGESDLKVGLYGDVKPAEDTTPHEWSLYALDLAGGKVLWHKVALRGTPKVKRHPKATHANASPVTDGKRVVAILGDTLFCYSTDGEQLWQAELGVLDVGWFYDPTYQWGHASSPILYQDRVLVQVDRQKDSYLAAFRLQDGKLLWRTGREHSSSWATPTLIEHRTEQGTRTLVVASGTPTIAGYDVETGEQVWTLGPMSEIAVGTPVTRGDVVYITGGYTPVRPIYAVKAGAKGAILLEDTDEDPNLAWARKTGGTYMPTPIVYGDYLYTLADNGVLACYRAETGEEVYRRRVAGGGVGYSGSPVAADGYLYLSTEDGDIHVIQAGPKYELVNTNPVGEVIMTTPAIVPGTFLVRGKHHLFAFGEATEEKDGAAGDG